MIYSFAKSQSFTLFVSINIQMHFELFLAIAVILTASSNRCKQFERFSCFTSHHKTLCVELIWWRSETCNPVFNKRISCSRPHSGMKPNPIRNNAASCLPSLFSWESVVGTLLKKKLSTWWFVICKGFFLGVKKEKCCQSKSVWQ